MYSAHGVKNGLGESHLSWLHNSKYAAHRRLNVDLLGCIAIAMEVLGENRVDFTQPHMEDWIALGPSSPPSPATASLQILLALMMFRVIDRWRVNARRISSSFIGGRILCLFSYKFQLIVFCLDFRKRVSFWIISTLTVTRRGD